MTEIPKIDGVAPVKRPAEHASGFIKKIKALTCFCFIALAGIFAADLFSPRVAGNPLSAELGVSGAELFANNCARCHGADGTGGKGPNLASEKRQTKWKESDEKLVKKITNGGFIMPSFGKKLKTEEIKEIANYVRGLKE